MSLITQSLNPRLACHALLLLSCLGVLVHTNENGLQPEYDVCNPRTQTRHPPSVYLSGPSNGDRFGQSTTVYVNWTWPRSEQTQSRGCLMLFKTCHACQIRVDAIGQDFSYRSCGRNPPQYEYDEADYCSRECAYIKLLDSDYKQQTLRRVTSSLSMQTFPAYKSQSSRLHVVACSRGLDKMRGGVSMRLRLSTVAKEQLIEGYVGAATISAQTFMSPYFPSPYVQNSEDYTYTFSGGSAMAITFDDWSLSPYSRIVFHDRVSSEYNGGDPRPYIISKNVSMKMTFHTGPQMVAGGYFSFLGFKAVARFYRHIDDVPRWVTGCDVTHSNSLGGVIKQSRFRDRQMRDCIWVIKPMTDHFAGVYIKVVKFTHGWGSWSSSMNQNNLEVRAGVTSDAPQRMHLTPTVRDIPDYAEQTSSNGFYIRLRGVYTEKDPLIIAYSQFRYDCSTGYRQYFKCGNGRCIDELLRCDRYDHCGDNTDELYCDEEDLNPVNNNEKSHNYNYSVSIGIIIPMVVAVFLVILICLLVIFFRRCRRLSSQRNGTNATAANGLLGGGNHRDGGRGQRRGRDRRRRHRGSRPSQMGLPPSFMDYPPSYDEVLHSTPVEMLNMAYSWSHPDVALGQPPSYEDAMIEAGAAAAEAAGSSAPLYSNNNNNAVSSNIENSGNANGGRRGSRSGSNPSIATTATSGNFPGLHARLPAGNARTSVIDNPNVDRHTNSVLLNVNPDMILDPNLDPGAYVSSSSSSEGEADMRMDLSSSSESSTDNEQGFIPRAASHFGHSTQHHEESLPQQNPSHPRHTLSPISSHGGAPDILNGESDNKSLSQRGTEEPLVIKEQDTPHQKSKDQDKEVDCSAGNENESAVPNREVDCSTAPKNMAVSENENGNRNPGSTCAVEESERNEERPSQEASAIVSGGSQPPNTDRQGTRRKGRRRHRSRHSRSNDSQENERSTGGSQSHRSRSRNREASSSQSHRGSVSREPEGQIQPSLASNQSQSDRHLESLQGSAPRFNNSNALNNAITMRSQSCFNLTSGHDSTRSGAGVSSATYPDKRFSYAGSGDSTVGQIHPKPSNLKNRKEPSSEPELLDRIENCPSANPTLSASLKGVTTLQGYPITSQELSACDMHREDDLQGTLHTLEGSNEMAVKASRGVKHNKSCASKLHSPCTEESVIDLSPDRPYEIQSTSHREDLDSGHRQRASCNHRVNGQNVAALGIHTISEIKMPSPNYPKSSRSSAHQRPPTIWPSTSNAARDVPIRHFSNEVYGFTNGSLVENLDVQQRGLDNAVLHNRNPPFRGNKEYPSPADQSIPNQSSNQYDDRRFFPSYRPEEKGPSQPPAMVASSEIAKIYGKRHSLNALGERRLGASPAPQQEQGSVATQSLKPRNSHPNVHSAAKVVPTSQPTRDSSEVKSDSLPTPCPSSALLHDTQPQKSTKQIDQAKSAATSNSALFANRSKTTAPPTNSKIMRDVHITAFTTADAVPSEFSGVIPSNSRNMPDHLNVFPVSRSRDTELPKAYKIHDPAQITFPQDQRARKTADKPKRHSGQNAHSIDYNSRPHRTIPKNSVGDNQIQARPDFAFSLTSAQAPSEMLITLPSRAETRLATPSGAGKASCRPDVISSLHEPRLASSHIHHHSRSKHPQHKQWTKQESHAGQLSQKDQGIMPKGYHLANQHPGGAEAITTDISITSSPVISHLLNYPGRMIQPTMRDHPARNQVHRGGGGRGQSPCQDSRTFLGNGKQGRAVTTSEPKDCYSGSVEPPQNYVLLQDDDETDIYV